MQQFLIGWNRKTTSNVLMGLVRKAASLFLFEWCICQTPRSAGPPLMQGAVNETSVGILWGPCNSINSSETGCDVVLAVSWCTLWEWTMATMWPARAPLLQWNWALSPVPGGFPYIPHLSLLPLTGGQHGVNGIFKCVRTMFWFKNSQELIHSGCCYGSGLIKKGRLDDLSGKTIMLYWVVIGLEKALKYKWTQISCFTAQFLSITFNFRK